MASVPGPDFRSIINSPQFTFLIGPGHSKLTIQSGLAKHVSSRLDGLMNNGITRESRHRIAVLEDEDVETFTGFCEFAYTGDYTVPSRPTAPDQQEGSLYGEPMSPVTHSHIPPPAPSPPSSPRMSRPEDSCAIWDDEDDLPKDEPVLPAFVKESLPLKENPVPQVQQEPEPQPQDEEEDSKLVTDPGKKGKKGAKGKKGKKKAVDERPAASSLTPPKTPPLADSKDEPKEDVKGGAKGDVPGATKDDPIVKTKGAAALEESSTALIPIEARSQPEEKQIESLEESSTPGDWFDFNPSHDPALTEAVRSEGSIKEDPPRSEGSLRGEPFFPLPSSRPAGMSLWDEFTAIQYPQFERRANPPNSALDDRVSRGEAPYILYHAKIYVFASRYLVPALAQLALSKLHRDLVAFPLRTTNASGHGDSSTVPFILELLHFTYKNTKRHDARFPSFDPSIETPSTRENRLRKLATHYVACKVRQLAAYRPEGHLGEAGDSPLTFRDLLNKTGELASALVFQLM